MDDLVLRALAELMPCGVQRGELELGGRTLRWVAAGTCEPAVVFDASLGEPGTLAWAGVLPAVARTTRVVAYDRAGLGASDPAAPMTLESQVNDLTAVLRATSDGPSVVVGHSWGGILAQLAALQQPELIAGLVLVDPAEEEYLAALPPHILREGIVNGERVLQQHAAGKLADTVREVFGPFARQLTDDDRLAELILDAHVSCYSRQSQARMIRDEHHLVVESLAAIRQRRAAAPLPDIPVVIFSATTGRPADERAMWTLFHAKLAGSLPQGRHIVLAETSHAINQERPGEIAAAIIGMIKDLRQR